MLTGLQSPAQDTLYGIQAQKGCDIPYVVGECVLTHNIWYVVRQRVSKTQSESQTLINEIDFALALCRGV